MRRLFYMIAVTAIISVVGDIGPDMDASALAGPCNPQQQQC